VAVMEKDASSRRRCLQQGREILRWCVYLFYWEGIASADEQANFGAR
jgi:hypothetical protein